MSVAQHTTIVHDEGAVLAAVRVNYDPADDEFSGVHQLLTSKDPALNAQGVELLLSMGGRDALDRYMVWRGWEVDDDHFSPGYVLTARVGETRWANKQQIPGYSASLISQFIHIVGRAEAQMLETIGRALLPRWGGVRL